MERYYVTVTVCVGLSTILDIVVVIDAGSVHNQAYFGEDSPPPKKTYNSPKRLPNCVL